MEKILPDISDKEIKLKKHGRHAKKETEVDWRCKHDITEKDFSCAEKGKEVLFLSDKDVRGLNRCKAIQMIIEDNSLASINLFREKGNNWWRAEIKGCKIATQRARVMLQDAIPSKPVLHLYNDKISFLKSGLLNKIQTKYGSFIDIRGQKKYNLPVYIYGTKDSQKRTIKELKQLCNQLPSMILSDSEVGLLLSHKKYIEEKFNIVISILGPRWSEGRPLMIYGTDEAKNESKETINTVLCRNLEGKKQKKNSQIKQEENEEKTHMIKHMPLEKRKENNTEKTHIIKNMNQEYEKERHTENHSTKEKEKRTDHRYAWRHNCIVNYIVNSCDKNFTVYSDLPGHTAPGGGSIPPELCITVQKPDIVIIDKHKKDIHLFELSCTVKKRIETRHLEKTKKYAHFLSDITQYKCTVNAFEVSNQGFISSRSLTTLTTLHSFVKPTINLIHFIKNISTISLNASNHIYICRNEPTFIVPPFILPPLDRERYSRYTKVPICSLA